jgi:hypothetical protein
MSVTPSQQSSSSRWWSRPKSRKILKDKTTPLPPNHSYPSLPRESENEKHPDHARKHSSKLKTIASAIGLKSKRHSITVQHPLPSIAQAQPPSCSDTHVSQPSRSRSKNASFTTTTEDLVVEPKSPLYLPPSSYIKSVIAIPDPDPFASNRALGSRNDVVDPSKLYIPKTNVSAPNESDSTYSKGHSPSLLRDRRPVRERLVSEPLLVGPRLLSPITSSPTSPKKLMAR